MKNPNPIVACLLASTSLFFSGCGDSDEFVFTNSVATPSVAPLLPPVAVNDTVSALGNATLNQTAANGVLVNDTINGGEISAFDAIGSQGGAIDLQADGSFTYSPVFGFVGTETFTYTLSNDDGDSTATVSLISTGRGLFVDNSVPDGGNGSQSEPFDTLAEGVAAAASGDIIYVFRGDGTSTGLDSDLTLAQGVNLIGEGQGLILAQTIAPQGPAPVIDATVTVSGDNTISGFSFEGSDQAILGNGVADVTITNNIFLDGQVPQEQVVLVDTTGAMTITGNTFSMDNSTEATKLDTASTGTCNIVLDDNTFVLPNPTADSDDCFQVVVDGSSVATIQMNNNAFTGSATGSTSHRRAFSLRTNDTSQTTLSASGNMATFVENFVVLDTYDSSSLSAILSGNTSDQSTSMTLKTGTFGDGSVTVVVDNCSFTNSQSYAIQPDVNDSGTLNLTVSNSTLSGFHSLDFDPDNSATLNLIVSNSMLTGIGGEALYVNELDDSSNLNIALRDSEFTTTMGSDAVYLEADNSSNLCAEITGNTFGNDLVFKNGTSGNFDVEQFGNAMGDVLATLNTFDSSQIRVNSGMVNSVADGACMIP